MAITEFGRTNRDLREKAAVSLRGMAIAIGYSAAYLSAVEIGDKLITDDLLERVANFFRGLGRKNAEINALYASASRTRKTVDVSNLDGEARQVVAVFAKKLSDMDRTARERFLKKVGVSIEVNKP